MLHRLMLALTALLLTAAPASAAKNPYTPTQVCGSGFRVIDSHVVSTPKRKLGATYLLYNAKTGRNCAATMKSFGVGKASYTSVVLQRQGGPERRDEGDFKYYAGPVRVKAPGVCVRWGGGITVGTQSAGFDTAYEHCG